MEIRFASIALTLAFVTAVKLAWRLANWVWFRPKKLEKLLRQQGLKGNSYRPLFGDFRELSEMLKHADSKPIDLDDNIIGRISPYIEQTINTYGRSSFVWLGPSPMILIVDPETTKEMLTKINELQKSHGSPLADFLLSGLVFHEGKKWAKHRKIINPAFHQEKLKLMTPAFFESCYDLIEEWKKLVPEEGSWELDVWPYLQNLTRDVISRGVFGSSYKEGERIFELLKQLTDVTVQVIQSIYIPGWRFLPTKTNRKLREIYERIRDAIKGIIDKRKEAIKGGQMVESQDLLGVLMESNSRERQEHGNKEEFGMSLKDVIDECKLLYFAGHETTSVLLVWTMILLCKNADWQKRAREEVLQVFGDVMEPDFDKLNQLKVVTSILYEVLRMYPPVPSLTRNVTRTTKIGDLTIPEGAMVGMLTIFMHYDPDLWGEDALEFNPDRFSQGILKAKQATEFATFLSHGVLGYA